MKEHEVRRETFETVRKAVMDELAVAAKYGQVIAPGMNVPERVPGVRAEAIREALNRAAARLGV